MPEDTNALRRGVTQRIADLLNETQEHMDRQHAGAMAQAWAEQRQGWDFRQHGMAAQVAPTQRQFEEYVARMRDFGQRDQGTFFQPIPPGRWTLRPNTVAVDDVENLREVVSRYVVTELPFIIIGIRKGFDVEPFEYIFGPHPEIINEWDDGDLEPDFTRVAEFVGNCGKDYLLYPPGLDWESMKPKVPWWADYLLLWLERIEKAAESNWFTRNGLLSYNTERSLLRTSRCAFSEELLSWSAGDWLRDLYNDSARLTLKHDKGVAV